MAVAQTLPKHRRLRKRKEFLHTQTEGQRLRSGCLVALLIRNRFGFCRLGITVTKKVCGAAGRNRIRRQLRESFRKNSKAKSLPVDLVVIPIPGSLEANVPADFARLVPKIWAFLSRKPP